MHHRTHRSTVAGAGGRLAAAAARRLQRPTPAPGSGCATPTRWCSPAPRSTDLVGRRPGRHRGLPLERRAPAPGTRCPVQVDQRHVEFLTKLRNGTGTTGPKPSPTPTRAPTPVPTRWPPSTPTTRSPSWPTTPAAPAPAGAGNPAGVVAGSGVRVTVTRPARRHPTATAGSGVGYVYLFERSGAALRPGPASTTSTTTSHRPTRWATPRTPRCRPTSYTTHFSARWTRDEPHASAPGPTSSTATATSSPSACACAARTRSRPGDGGYATNIDGPVRVIRSYLGANSGTYTQREHIFYRGPNGCRRSSACTRSPGSWTSTTTAPPPSACGTRARRRPGRHRRRRARRGRLRRPHLGGRRGDPGHARVDYQRC